MPMITPAVLATALETNCTVFVESGTAHGASYQLALDSRQFDSAYSVEIVEQLYQELLKKFQQTDSQRIFLGDSQDILKHKILPLCKPEDRIFFWLDGHYSAGITGGKDMLCPVLEELKVIQTNTPTRKMVIAIDDTDDLGRQDPDVPGFNWPTRAELEAIIYQINPDFQCFDFSGAGSFEKQGRGVLVYSDIPMQNHAQTVISLQSRLARNKTIRRYRSAISRRLKKIFR